MNAPKSTGWKTKLFGDTRTNFYGWILGGLVVIGLSLWFVVLAFEAGAEESPIGLLLLAIYFVQLGPLESLYRIITHESHACSTRNLQRKVTPTSPNPYEKCQGAGKWYFHFK